jgi:2-polyprenyl-3-methyl-5-hydroxy-6-metoxy-1,4-benzoquinol methylase
MRIYLTHREMMEEGLYKKGVVLFHEIHGVYLVTEKGEPVNKDDVGFVRVLSPEEVEHGVEYVIETVECRRYMQILDVKKTSTPAIVHVPEALQVALVDPHIDRFYLWGPMCTGRRVLDVGCGWGYGAWIMAKYAKEVVAIDIEPDEIAFAKTHNDAPNITYVLGPLEKYEAEKFDVEICTEVLEHLEYPAMGDLLNSMRRLLSKDGVALFTTPCQDVTKRGNNANHVREYCYVDLLKILKVFFTPVGVWWYDWDTCTVSNRYRSGGRDGKQSRVSQCIFCRSKG